MKLLRISLGLLILIIYLTFYILRSYSVYASEYVLPYPSYMPGNKLYKVHLIWEKAQKYWHFGNIAKFKYYLSMSDKYLVEAKTLFEYRQYLLAVRALEKSDKYFKKSKIYLKQAINEYKNVSQKENTLYNASMKHKEVLNELVNKVPRSVVWKEENKPARVIYIDELFNRSIKIRT